MNILAFNWRDAEHPAAGGAEAFIHETAGLWTASGHDVVLICANASKSRRTVERVRGIRVVRVGGRYSVYVAAALEYRDQWLGWADVVVEHINGVPFFTPLYAKEPVVAVLYHLVDRIFLNELAFPFSAIGYSLERTVPHIYGEVPFVTISPSSKMDLVQRGIPPSNVHVVYCGTRLPPGPPSLERKENLVVYVGRLKRYKRLDLIVDPLRRTVTPRPESPYLPSLKLK